jgi:hypothetical protein
LDADVERGNVERLLNIDDVKIIHREKCHC